MNNLSMKVAAYSLGSVLKKIMTPQNIVTFIRLIVLVGLQVLTTVEGQGKAGADVPLWIDWLKLVDSVGKQLPDMMNNTEPVDAEKELKTIKAIDDLIQ